MDTYTHELFAPITATNGTDQITEIELLPMRMDHLRKHGSPLRNGQVDFAVASKIVADLSGLNSVQIAELHSHEAKDLSITNHVRVDREGATVVAQERDGIIISEERR